MTTQTTGSPPVFDPFSDEFFNDPYDLYRRMRDDAPVSFNERYGFWALFRYEDVALAHREWQTFSSAHGVDLSMLTKPPELVRALNSMIMLDPPEHDRLRALVSRVFTPRAVAALEPMVREVICQLSRSMRRRAASTWSRTSRGRSRSRSSPACSACRPPTDSRSATGST